MYRVPEKIPRLRKGKPVDNDTNKSERTIRIQEAYIDTTFITILGAMFYLNCDTSSLAIAFTLALALAAGIVLYRAYSFEDEEYEAS